jgi:hypothetical protein
MIIIIIIIIVIIVRNDLDRPNLRTLFLSFQCLLLSHT